MDLKKIWKNRKEIYEGIKNAIIRDVIVEDIAEKRLVLCNECPSKGDECEVPGTAPCCNECGCSLAFKIRSLSSECPLEKWKSIITEEQEDKLDEL
tara:strand:- start:219 stop:506 length:288 start_codon:yes stop_codon:yes gene_type:complete